MWFKQMTAIAAGVLLSSNVVYALESMNDDEMRQAEGQALVNLTTLLSGAAGNPTPVGQGVSFYTAGIEGTLALNAQIRRLQAGCGGDNGAVGCDIDVQNFSFGCIANGAGVCITLPPTGRERTGTNNDNTLAGQQQMRDVVLTNPFLQFAIKNAGSASTREFVGLRLGAANATGPLSFGQVNTISGFLSATANLTIGGAANVAATCRFPTDCEAVGSDTSGVRNQGASSWGAPQTGNIFTGIRGNRGTPAGGYLNLGDDVILDIGLARIRFQEALVSYQTVSRNNLGVLLSGNRQTQAQISGVNLGGVVNSIIYGNTDGSTTVGANPLTLADSDAGALVGAFGPTLLPLLRGGIADQIKRQMAQGLRIYSPNAATNQTTLDARTDDQVNTDLNNYVLPYNAANLHQVDLNTNSFGLSLQKEALQYPGYVQAVSRGWALHLPNAFTLDINQPLATQYNAAGAITSTGILQGITGNSDARDGNIVGLPAPYRNCFGTLTFC